VLGHRLGRVAGDVGDHDTAGRSRSQVHAIIAGRGDSDHPQPRCSGDGGLPDRRLVGDDDVGVDEAFGNLLGRRPGMLDPHVIGGRPVEPHRRCEAVAVEEDDAHGSLQGRPPGVAGKANRNRTARQTEPILIPDNSRFDLGS